MREAVKRRPLDASPTAVYSRRIGNRGQQVDQYCVVVCGLQAGAPGDASAWLPVAAALKLDQGEFARRVLAALPRIVRRNLDRATAERIAQLLQGMHVDARALPDDGQLAYIDCPGTSCGPLPLASLGDFIQPGETYRLHGSMAWQAWPAALDQAPAESASLAFDFDDAAPLPDGESFDATPDAPLTAAVDGAPDDAIAATPDDLPGGSDEEVQDTLSTPSPAEAPNDFGAMSQDTPPPATDYPPPRAMPPPLPAPPSVETPPAAAPPDHADIGTPAVDVDDSARHDELINPPEDDLAPADPDAATPVAPEGGDGAAPARSRGGRVFALLVILGLAGWAYSRWIGDAHTDAPPLATMATSQPGAANARSAALARAASVRNPVPATVPAASVAAPASTPAPAAAASVPAPAATTTALPAAASTPAPAAISAAPSPAASTGSPAIHAGAPAPASTAPASTASPATPPH